VADGGQDDVGSIAGAAFEVTAAEVIVSLHVADRSFEGRAAAELAFDDAEDPRFSPEMKMPRGFGVAGRDIIWITRQRLGMEHKLATWGAGVGGDDRDLDPELIGRAGLALADAFDLRRMEAIKLPTALPLPLGADLVGARERAVEYRIEFGIAGNLAPDVADDAAEPRA